MHSYRVVASNPRTAIVALEDAAGQTHLARTLVQPPAPGTPLTGAAPAVGLAVLTSATAGEPLPIAMVLLDCDPVVAVKLVLIAEAEVPPQLR